MSHDPTGPFVHGETHHNRIRAAVNACAGIPTEALEADVVRRMREALAKLLSTGPQEGDYRIALLACKGRELSPEDHTCADRYGVARKDAVALLASIDGDSQ